MRQSKNILDEYTRGITFTSKKTQKALNIAFNIMDKWALSADEQRAILSLSEEASLDKHADIAADASKELQFRSSIIIGLYADLKIVPPSPELMSNWLRKTRADGETPINALMSDEYQQMLNLRASAKSLRY